MINNLDRYMKENGSNEELFSIITVGLKINIIYLVFILIGFLNGLGW